MGGPPRFGFPAAGASVGVLVRRVALLVLGSSMVFGISVSAGSAAPALRPPAGSPDPKPMVLVASDLAKAKVTAQGYYKDADFPSVISYSREFEEGRVGSTELLYLDSEAEIGRSASSTRGFFNAMKRTFSTKQGRAALKKQFTKEFGTEGADLQVGWPRAFGVGEDAFDLPMTLRMLGMRAELHLAVFRLDRVLGAVILVAAPGERGTRTAAVRLSKVMAARARVELRPQNTAPPTILGSAQVGQTLTATGGTWKNASASLVFQWQRCDASGASCVDIPGAAARPYAPSAADVGSTLRVEVTAASRFGSQTTASAPTAVVTNSAGAPVNTAPPTIAGVAQQGQTLSAATGTWANEPTSFAYHWQRCDATGAGCADISGATAGTYAVTSADVGSTLRVRVTSSNAAGSAEAVSMPTSVVT